MLFALPTLANGTTTCSIFFVGVAGSCNAPGLAPASPAEIAAGTDYFTSRGLPVPMGAICEVDQLAPGCGSEATSGWCYVSGSCLADAGATCTQTLCASAGLVAESLVVADTFLACP